MRRTRSKLPLLSLLLLMVAAPMSAQTFQEETANDLTGVRDKFLGLARTMPDDAMIWRPEEGVRSVSEVYMHIALANIGLMSNFWGADQPTNMRPEWGTEGEQVMDRASILAAIETGFDHVINTIRAMPDSQLTQPASVFGRPANVMAGIMLIRSHSHEHLGQSIAYARSNGVVPPWSN